MKKTKQRQLLQCLKTGRYRVNADLGIIESRVGGVWIVKKGCKLPTGYIQHILFRGRGKGKGIPFYEHIVVFMSVYGLYDVGLVVEHINKNRSDNRLSNLQLISPSENKLRSPSMCYSSDLRLIRSAEIADIRRLMALGMSKSAIARELNLNRLSVLYIINRINKNLPLKYEFRQVYKI
jgi:hypothetical protein